MPSPAPANVRVIVRVRPLNDAEVNLNGTIGRTNVISLENKSMNSQFSETIGIIGDSIDGGASNLGPKYFTFDAVHGPKSSQIEVFESVKEIVDAVTSGYNGTIVAYGQTGSGKSFTVFGNTLDDEQNLGLVQISLRAIFDKMSSSKQQKSTSGEDGENNTVVGSIKTEFRASFLEIFNDRVYDLLTMSDALGIALSVREDVRGVYVDGLKEVVVTSAEDAERVLVKGIANRHVASTNMNRASSRSHAVFTLNIRSEHTTSDGLQKIRLSKFTLVDLAGSERQKKTAVLGERLKEASMINKSLLCLGHVINALVDREAGRERHIPFRDSKLTFLLRDSWGGNSKTCLIATVSPSAASMSETISTLSFAQRAKLIRNTAVLNEDTCGSIAALQAEVLRLRSLLQNNLKPTSMGAELNEIISNPEDGCVATMTRKVRKAEEKALILEHQISEKQEVIQTLKRKLDEAVMVRKFKERRIEYFQKKTGATEESEIILSLQKEIEILRNELDKPSIGAIHWKAEYERLKDEVTKNIGCDAREGNALTEELTKLDETIIRLMREKEDNLRSINELTQSLSEAQEEIDVLLHEIDRLESEIASVQVQVKSNKIHCGTLELEAADAKAELLKLKDLMQRQERDSLSQENSYLIEIGSLKDQLLIMENRLSSTSSALEKMKVDYSDLQSINDRLDDELKNTANKYETIIATQQHELTISSQAQIDLTKALEKSEADTKRITEALIIAQEMSDCKELDIDEERLHFRDLLEDKQIVLDRTQTKLNETVSSMETISSSVNDHLRKLVDIVNAIISTHTLTFKNDINIQPLTLVVDSCQNSIRERLDSALNELMRSVSLLFSSLCGKDLELVSRKQEYSKIQNELSENLCNREEVTKLHDALRLNEGCSQALRTEMDGLNNHLFTLAHRISSYQAEIDHLSCLLNARDGDIDLLKMQLISYESIRTNLDTSLTEITESKAALEDEYKRKIVEMKNGMALQETKLEQLSSLLVQSESLRSSLNDEWSSKLIDSDQKIQSFQHMLTSIQTQLLDKDGELLNAQEKISDLQKELLSLQSDCDTSKLNSENIISSLRVDLSRLEENNTSLLSEIQQCTIERKNHVDELNQLRLESQQLNDLLKQKSDRLIESDEKAQSLSSALSELDAHYIGRLNHIHAKEEASTKKSLLLEDRITLLKREKASLAFELDTLKEDHDTLMDQVRQLSDRVQCLEQENSSFKQDSSSNSITTHAMDERDELSVKSGVTSQDSVCYSTLSAEMDVFLSRLSTASGKSNQCPVDTNQSPVDDSMDESLFLPNNELSSTSVFPSKENSEPKISSGFDTNIDTPVKKEYGIRRQPLSELKQTPVTSHTAGTSLSSKKKISSGNKHRSNWMIYDNTKIFDR